MQLRPSFRFISAAIATYLWVGSWAFGLPEDPAALVPLSGDITLFNGDVYTVVKRLGQGGMKEAYLAVRTKPICPDEQKCQVVINRQLLKPKVSGAGPPSVKSGEHRTGEVGQRHIWDAETVVLAGHNDENIAELAVQQFNQGAGSPYLRRELGEVIVKEPAGLKVSIAEYADHSLHDVEAMFRVSKQMQPNQARAIRVAGEDMYASLEALEGLDVVHRDTKAQNIFVRADGPFTLQGLIEGKSNLILGDNDLAVFVGSMPDDAGVRGLMGPDLFHPKTMKPTAARDLYGASVSMYMLNFGKHPIEDFFLNSGDIPREILETIPWQWYMLQNPKTYQKFLNFVDTRYERVANQVKGGIAEDLRATKELVLNGLQRDPKARKLQVPHPLPDTTRRRVILERDLQVRKQFERLVFPEDASAAVLRFSQAFCARMKTRGQLPLH